MPIDVFTNIASPLDLQGWSALRAALWPSGSISEHELEATAWLAAPDTCTCIAKADDGQIIGFAETSLRREYVNGCETTPVIFLEGIYVLPSYRRAGIAAELCAAVEKWGRSMGCTELGSDADSNNQEGIDFHLGAGFAQREQIVCFRKRL